MGFRPQMVERPDKQPNQESRRTETEDLERASEVIKKDGKSVDQERGKKGPVKQAIGS